MQLEEQSSKSMAPPLVIHNNLLWELKKCKLAILWPEWISGSQAGEKLGPWRQADDKSKLSSFFSAQTFSKPVVRFRALVLRIKMHTMYVIHTTTAENTDGIKFKYRWWQIQMSQSIIRHEPSGADTISRWSNGWWPAFLEYITDQRFDDHHFQMNILASQVQVWNMSKPISKFWPRATSFLGRFPNPLASWQLGNLTTSFWASQLFLLASFFQTDN